MNTVETYHHEKTFKKCYYVPVSFSLFLIMLTFPLQPTVESITIYNLWLSLTFRILPLDCPFETYLKQLKFDVEHNPLTTREQFFYFLVYMHELVFKKKMDKLNVLRFFHCLRANECNHVTKDEEGKNKEGGCKRKSQKTENVSLLLIKKLESNQDLISSSLTSSFSLSPAIDASCEVDCFVIDEKSIQVSLTDAEKEQEYKMLLENSGAFCSSVFSIKWFLLHLVASQFPQKNVSESQKYVYHTWLTLFGKVLACFACQINFQSNIELVHYNPQRDLSDRDSFVTLIYNLHNIVNNMLRKKQTTLTLQAVKDFYDLLQQHTTDEHRCHIFITPKEEYTTSRFYFFE